MSEQDNPGYGSDPYKPAEGTGTGPKKQPGNRAILIGTVIVLAFLGLCCGGVTVMVASGGDSEPAEITRTGREIAPASPSESPQEAPEVVEPAEDGRQAEIELFTAVIQTLLADMSDADLAEMCWGMDVAPEVMLASFREGYEDSEDWHPEYDQIVTDSLNEECDQRGM
jgi:hypothetical protein